MKRLLTLFTVSVGLGFLGLYLVSREALLDPTSYRPEDVSTGRLLLCGLLLVALWMVPYVRIQILARSNGFILTPLTSLLTHVIAVFGVAMTPSGSGGGPALIAALNRLGVPWGTGLGIAIQIFILDLVVFAWLIPPSLIYLVFVVPGSLPPSVEVLAALATVLAIAAALLLGRYPKQVAKGLVCLAKRRVFKRFRLRLVHTARDYASSAKIFAAMPLGTWILLQFVTLISWLASFMLLWTLAGLFGMSVRILDIVAVLSVITLISFVVPTPGASGFMEVAVGLGTAAQTADPLAAPILFWRLSTFYIVYLLGPLCGWLLLLRNPPTWLRRLRRLPERHAKE